MRREHFLSAIVVFLSSISSPIWSTPPTSSDSAAHHALSARVGTISACNCYSVEYAESDCMDAPMDVLQNATCDGAGEFINPFYVYAKKRELGAACVGYLLERASTQTDNILQNYLKGPNYRGVVELGGSINVLNRNRLLDLPSVSAFSSDSNTCGIDQNVITAANDVSGILFPTNDIGFLLGPTLEQIRTDAAARLAEENHSSASTIKAAHRRRDAIFLNEMGPMATDYCNAIDPCKVLGGTNRTVDGFNFCQVDGIAYDASCFNLPPHLRARFMRNLSGARNRGVSCLRSLGGSATTAGDRLEEHFSTSVSNGLPRSQVCCGNNGCNNSPTAFGLGGAAHNSERLRPIGGISYGGAGNHGAVIFSNSTIESTDPLPTQGLMFHEFLHRTGTSNSCLHNHQDRRDMRPDSRGRCYPASDGPPPPTSEIIFTNIEGRCVADQSSPNLACAQAMTLLPIDQYDPIYACQTACFSNRPTEAGPTQGLYDRSKELCRQFVASNGMESANDSTKIKALVKEEDGTVREQTTCDMAMRAAEALYAGPGAGASATPPPTTEEATP